MSSVYEDAWKILAKHIQKAQKEAEKKAAESGDAENPSLYNLHYGRWSAYGNILRAMQTTLFDEHTRRENQVKPGRVQCEACLYQVKDSIFPRYCPNCGNYKVYKPSR